MAENNIKAGIELDGTATIAKFRDSLEKALSQVRPTITPKIDTKSLRNSISSLEVPVTVKIKNNIKGQIQNNIGKFDLEFNDASVKKIKQLFSSFSNISLDFNPERAQEYRVRVERYFSEHPIAIKVALTGSQNSNATVKSAEDLRKQISNTLNGVGGGGNNTGARVLGSGGDDAHKKFQKAIAANRKELEKLRKEEEETAKSTFSFSERLGATTARFGSFIIAGGALVKLQEGLATAKDTIVEVNREAIKLTQTLGGNTVQAIDLVNASLATAAKYGQNYKAVLGTTNLLARSGSQFSKPEDIKKTTDLLTQTKLVAGFGELDDTTNGLIATLNQFNLTASSSQDVLDLVDTAAKKSGVGVTDLFDAVKQGGAVFNEAGGTLKEYLAIVSTLRERTKIAPSAIGAGINNIALRLTHEDIIAETSKLTNGAVFDKNGNLKDTVDQLKEIAKATKSFDNEKLLKTITLISGDRQQSKLLLPFFKDLQQADTGTSTFDKQLQSLDNSAGEFSRDTSIGLQSIDVQLDKIGARFSQVFGALENDKSIKNLVADFASLANAVAFTVEKISPILPALIKLGTIKLVMGAFGSGISDFFKGFYGNKNVSFTKRGARRGSFRDYNKTHPDELESLDDFVGITPTQTATKSIISSHQVDRSIIGTTPSGLSLNVLNGNEANRQIYLNRQKVDAQNRLAKNREMQQNLSNILSSQIEEQTPFSQEEQVALNKSASGLSKISKIDFFDYAGLQQRVISDTAKSKKLSPGNATKRIKSSLARSYAQQLLQSNAPGDQDRIAQGVYDISSAKQQYDASLKANGSNTTPQEILRQQASQDKLRQGAYHSTLTELNSRPLTNEEIVKTAKPGQIEEFRRVALAEKNIQVEKALDQYRLSLEKAGFGTNEVKTRMATLSSAINNSTIELEKLRLQEVVIEKEGQQFALAEFEAAQALKKQSLGQRFSQGATAFGNKVGNFATQTGSMIKSAVPTLGVLGAIAGADYLASSLSSSIKPITDSNGRLADDFKELIRTNRTDRVASSTLSGASTGALLGFSVGGPIGAAAGGVVGAGIGFVTGKLQADAEEENATANTLSKAKNLDELGKSFDKLSSDKIKQNLRPALLTEDDPTRHSQALDYLLPQKSQLLGNNPYINQIPDDLLKSDDGPGLTQKILALSSDRINELSKTNLSPADIRSTAANELGTQTAESSFKEHPEYTDDEKQFRILASIRLFSEVLKTISDGTINDLSKSMQDFNKEMNSATAGMKSLSTFVYELSKRISVISEGNISASISQGFREQGTATLFGEGSPNFQLPELGQLKLESVKNATNALDISKFSQEQQRQIIRGNIDQNFGSGIGGEKGGSKDILTDEEVLRKAFDPISIKAAELLAERRESTPGGTSAVNDRILGFGDEVATFFQNVDIKKLGLQTDEGKGIAQKYKSLGESLRENPAALEGNLEQLVNAPSTELQNSIVQEYNANLNRVNISLKDQILLYTQIKGLQQRSIEFQTKDISRRTEAAIRSNITFGQTPFQIGQSLTGISQLSQGISGGTDVNVLLSDLKSNQKDFLALQTKLSTDLNVSSDALSKMSPQEIAAQTQNRGGDTLQDAKDYSASQIKLQQSNDALVKYNITLANSVNTAKTALDQWSQVVNERIQGFVKAGSVGLGESYKAQLSLNQNTVGFGGVFSGKFAGINTIDQLKQLSPNDFKELVGRATTISPDLANKSITGAQPLSGLPIPGGNGAIYDNKFEVEKILLGAVAARRGGGDEAIDGLFQSIKNQKNAALTLNDLENKQVDLLGKIYQTLRYAFPDATKKADEQNNTKNFLNAVSSSNLATGIANTAKIAGSALLKTFGLGGPSAKNGGSAISQNKSSNNTNESSSALYTLINIGTQIYDAFTGKISNTTTNGIQVSGSSTLSSVSINKSNISQKPKRDIHIPNPSDDNSSSVKQYKLASGFLNMQSRIGDSFDRQEKIVRDQYRNGLLDKETANVQLRILEQKRQDENRLNRNLYQGDLTVNASRGGTEKHDQLIRDITGITPSVRNLGNLSGKTNYFGSLNHEQLVSAAQDQAFSDSIARAHRAYNTDDIKPNKVLPPTANTPAYIEAEASRRYDNAIAKLNVRGAPDTGIKDAQKIDANTRSQLDKVNKNPNESFDQKLLDSAKILNDAANKILEGYKSKVNQETSSNTHTKVDANVTVTGFDNVGKSTAVTAICVGILDEFMKQLDPSNPSEAATQTKMGTALKQFRNA